VRIEYYLECTSDQVPFYLEHLVARLYGADPTTCRIETRAVNVVRIGFCVDNMRPLVNSLPRTEVIAEPAPWTPEEDTVVQIINRAFEETTILSYRCYPDTTAIYLTPAALHILVRRLARARVCDVFVHLSSVCYVIARTAQYQVLVLFLSNSILEVSLLNSSDICFFDVDEGYSGIMAPLNGAWRRWKEAGNLEAPIHPPNRV
jgi:hypothetical protein